MTNTRTILAIPLLEAFLSQQNLSSLVLENKDMLLKGIEQTNSTQKF